MGSPLRHTREDYARSKRESGASIAGTVCSQARKKSLYFNRPRLSGHSKFFKFLLSLNSRKDFAPRKQHHI